MSVAGKGRSADAWFPGASEPEQGHCSRLVFAVSGLSGFLLGRRDSLLLLTRLALRLLSWPSWCGWVLGWGLALCRWGSARARDSSSLTDWDTWGLPGLEGFSLGGLLL